MTFLLDIGILIAALLFLTWNVAGSYWYSKIAVEWQDFEDVPHKHRILFVSLLCGIPAFLVTFFAYLYYYLFTNFFLSKWINSQRVINWINGRK